MMTAKLKFKAVRSKNFRSVGNQFIEVDLSGGKTLVCSNENGSGKSTTLLHALTYVLFDKSYQKGQKKTSLVNSKNGKDCVVEVEFDTKGSEWLVRRGMKPNLFDIVKDGVRITDEAAKNDYQAYLISVLGMDDKVFHNTVALGRDKFVPFNELSAGESRNLGEVMLDQQIFSTANEVAKQDLKALKAEANDVGYLISKTEARIIGSERVIAVLKGAIASKAADNAGLVAGMVAERQGYEQKLALAEPLIDSISAELTAEMEKLTGSQEADAALTRVDGMRSQLMERAANSERTRDRLVSMDNCPTCQQIVSEERKAKVRSEMDPEISKLKDGVTRISEMRHAAHLKVQDFKQIAERVSEINHRLSVAHMGVKSLKGQIDSINARINSLSVVQDSGDEGRQLVQEEVALADYRTELVAQKDAELALLKKETNLNVLLKFLKDDGFKAEITKLYIPLLNLKVNEFLDAMNLFVNIQLDEEFNMTMIAPDRKGQTIADLSTGQMRRIDLAMLLGWREVAQAKSSVDTNLVIFDETLENLSAQGVSDFVDFMEGKYPDMDMFVITQRADEFSEYFDKVIKYSLKDDFTVIV